MVPHLKECIFRAQKIDIIVSFLMESGVRLLVNDFKDAVDRGAILRILCGNYLKITQPPALYLLKDMLEDKVDLRFYNVPNKSFHPKAYLFEYGDNSDIFIGSSNMSRSALTDGIEWNYRLNFKSNPEEYLHFKKTFDDLFLNKSIIINDHEMRKYSKNWRRPKIFEDIERLEDGNGQVLETGYSKVASDECEIINVPFPMGPQIEALYELKKSRLEGWDKGLVVAATGTGKTFLAAFDSLGYERILFVAHREEILRQTEKTYLQVRPDASVGYFSGNRKDKNADILLATVQTLGRKEYLNEEYFAVDDFDYIVIDEFHHVVAQSYLNMIAYFKPKFLLGLTATPERMDNQDVFALCDYNIVYEARLKEAINKGWLVPYRYYGIFDQTNYDHVDYKYGKYDVQQLEEVLSSAKRADLILEHYRKYRSKRALGFCSGRKHAVYMAEYFLRNGINACAVISDDKDLSDEHVDCIMDRKEAVEKLKKGQINIIFSVDIFNEGLDIPQVDMVMFLRPTESPTVFLQQLGRGLRKSGGKKYINVLDFIGNYKKANLIPFFLTGDVKGYDGKAKITRLPCEEDYPDGCLLDFDLQLIDLFQRLDQEQKGVFEKVCDEFHTIKDKLGDKPLRLGMYTYMDEGLYKTIRTKKELNIFRDYLSFLRKIEEASDTEKSLIGTKAHDFLKEMEGTNMTKMYKMPVLLAFYNNGDMKMKVDEDDLFHSFKTFYANKSNTMDLIKDKSTSGYLSWGKKEYVSLARHNPMKFLMQSASQFFYEEGELFCLTPELEEFITNREFIRHFKDIIDYRTIRFYKERLEQRKAQEENE